MTQLVHFYQTGTFTAGNRLLDPEDRSIQSSMERFNSLTSGHRACQGCGAVSYTHLTLPTILLV